MDVNTLISEFGHCIFNASLDISEYLYCILVLILGIKTSCGLIISFIFNKYDINSSNKDRLKYFKILVQPINEQVRF
jgi:hypothetical protein